MKRTISMLLAFCIAALVCASCGRADAPEQTTQAVQTTVTEATTLEETTAEETTDEETTAEEMIVEETEQAGVSELAGFYQRLCADSWVEICGDLSNAMRVQIAKDNAVQIEYNYECDGKCETESSTYRAKDAWGRDNKIQCVSDDGWGGVYFVDDLANDDLLHYDGEGIISDHRILIRESRLNEKTDFADRLRNTRWKSKWFADNGIQTVRIADFDIYPINETTVYLEYPSKIGSDRVRATVVQTQDDQTLEVYMITTYAEEGYCPETMLIAEQWSAVS